MSLRGKLFELLRNPDSVSLTYNDEDARQLRSLVEFETSVNASADVDLRRVFTEMFYHFQEGDADRGETYIFPGENTPFYRALVMLYNKLKERGISTDLLYESSYYDEDMTSDGQQVRMVSIDDLHREFLRRMEEHSDLPTVGPVVPVQDDYQSEPVVLGPTIQDPLNDKPLQESNKPYVHGGKKSKRKSKRKSIKSKRKSIKSKPKSKKR
jgi:hypothetical protein